MSFFRCIASESEGETRLLVPSSVSTHSTVSNPCRVLPFNQLTGSIPDTIGNLAQLTYLYVE
jgi:hypothetical protein